MTQTLPVRFPTSPSPTQSALTSSLTTRFLTLFLTVGLLATVGLCAAPAVAQRPVIEQIRPRSGAVGTSVTLVGRGFTQQTRIFLGPVEMPVSQRWPNRWVVLVPGGAQSGPILINTPSGSFSGPYFRVSAAAAAAVIQTMTPAAGPAGTEVRLVGSGFGVRPSDNRVVFAGRPVIVHSASPTELRVTVPQGASTGRFEVRVGQSVTQSPDFVIAAGLAITSLNPPMAIPGGQLTIIGTGFASNIRQNRVFLGRRRLRLRSASPTQLVVDIPRNAATGSLVVDLINGGRVNGGRVELPRVTVGQPPLVRSLSSSFGRPGMDFHIVGERFGHDRRQTSVMLHGQPLHILSVSARDIHVRLPRRVAAANAGEGLRIVIGGIAATGIPTFDWLSPLQVTGFQPRSGSVGTMVRIQGRGFPTDPRAVQVLLSGSPQQVVASSPNEIRVRITGGASGQLEVRSSGGSASTRRAFVTQNTPAITQFSPQGGPVGQEVRITGANFGNRPALVRVEIGRTQMQVVSVRDNEVVVRVPRGARSGQISVTVGMQGGAMSAGTFEVGAHRRVFEMTPSQAYPGVEVVFRGEGFPRTGTMIRFTGNIPVQARRISPVELRVTVPRRAQTGPVAILLPNRRVIEAGSITITRAPRGVAVTQVDAQCDQPGCVAVLRGHGFDARTRVSFEGVAVTVEAITINTIRIRIPDRAGSGRFTVRVGRRNVHSPTFVIILGHGAAVPATTVPATTVPATTVPATTVPATTVPSTTVPPTSRRVPRVTPPARRAPAASRRAPR